MKRRQETGISFVELIARGALVFVAVGDFGECG
jgi:hypothetical protein